MCDDIRGWHTATSTVLKIGNCNNAARWNHRVIQSERRGHGINKKFPVLFLGSNSNYPAHILQNFFIPHSFCCYWGWWRKWVISYFVLANKTSTTSNHPDRKSIPLGSSFTYFLTSKPDDDDSRSVQASLEKWAIRHWRRGPNFQSLERKVTIETWLESTTKKYLVNMVLAGGSGNLARLSCNNSDCFDANSDRIINSILENWPKGKKVVFAAWRRRRRRVISKMEPWLKDQSSHRRCH